MWRAVTEREPFFDGRTMMLVGHMERRMVVYPISEAGTTKPAITHQLGRRAEDRAGQPMPKQDWEFTRRPEDSRRPRSPTFASTGSTCRRSSAARTRSFQYPMVDRDPLPTLDVRPGHAARRCRAPDVSRRIERCLAGDRRRPRARPHLVTAADVDEGLERYEEIRRPLTSQIVLANRNVGPERMMELAEAAAPDGFDDIHDVVTEEEMIEISSSYKRMAGFDAAALNERPSWSVS